MLVDDYTMVVKGLDAVTEDSAKALLEPILEQTRTNLKSRSLKLLNQMNRL